MTVFWIIYALSVVLLSAFFCLIWSYAGDLRQNPNFHSPQKSWIELVIGRLKFLIFILFPVMNTIFAILILLNWDSLIHSTMDKIRDDFIK